MHHLKADLGMAGWFYQAAVYIILMIALDLQAKGDWHHSQYRNQCCRSCWWWECQCQQSSWLVHFNVSNCSWEDKHIWELSFYNCFIHYFIHSPRFSISLHAVLRSSCFGVGVSQKIPLVAVIGILELCLYVAQLFIRWSCGVLAVNDVFGLGIATLPSRLRWIHHVGVNNAMHSPVNPTTIGSSESSL